MASQSKSTSSSMPSSTSGANVPLPPPPSFQTSQRKSTPTIQATLKPGVFFESPVLVSNDEILSMFTLVKQQMKQQQETNQMLMKEIQTFKSNSKKPIEDVITPLQPRILNFNSAGSSKTDQGDFIPMQAQNTTAGPS